MYEIFTKTEIQYQMSQALIATKLCTDLPKEQL